MVVGAIERAALENRRRILAMRLTLKDNKYHSASFRLVLSRPLHFSSPSRSELRTAHSVRSNGTTRERGGQEIRFRSGEERAQLAPIRAFSWLKRLGRSL